MKRLFAFAFLLVSASAAWADSNGFSQWLAEFSAVAAKQGISPEISKQVLSQAFEDVSVVHLDRKQPEGKISFTQYRKNILSPDRIRKGRSYLHIHRALLNDIAKHYGVEPQYILALWGIETNFGGYTGNFNIIPSLATLAYEGRRAEFFQGELIAAMKMVQNENVALSTMIGSWAGAMGQCQFMPSSYLKYAVDWDKDGKKDIWGSLPDVFASIANYLKTEGWDGSLRWGRAVQLPAGLKLVHEDLYTKLPLSEIAAKGVRAADGSALPVRDVEAYLMHPGEPHEGAFVVYENYHVLLHWNKSRYFATNVGLLADAIAAGGN